jgi:hypothetical protein
MNTRIGGSLSGANRNAFARYEVGACGDRARDLIGFPRSRSYVRSSPRCGERLGRMSFASRIGFNIARSAPAERSSADRSKNESPAFPQSQGGNG